MKNKMRDVRDHLVSMLEELGDPKADASVIERAKATSQVAGTYIQAVRTELDAVRMAQEHGYIPEALARSLLEARDDGDSASTPAGSVVVLPRRAKR